MADSDPTRDDELNAPPTRSTRDRDELRQRLTEWLAARVGTDVTLGELSSPDGSGMSSETLLFDAAWDDGNGPTEHALVARVEPAAVDVPVFPTYDLELQYRVMELVGAKSSVPVPATRWFEPDPAPLGAPFFVMDRMSGRVPSDIPPYLMDGWLLAASAEQQRELQDATVRMLADLHSIDITGLDVDFLETPAPGDTPLQRHVNNQRAYYDWSRGDRRHPIVEASFDWLDANWPDDEGPTVIGWGDGRIGNIMYAADGFQPVAVLDWEMAALAPPEMDIAWMMFLHTFFQEIAEALGMEGMPDFLRRDDVVATYEAHSGHTVQNLEFFEVYAALRHAMIMTKVRERSVHFGEAEWSDDLDDCIPHRHVMEQMIDGSWWR
ncbi:MAG: phosphotransferase family protein [Acidimicrobiales bacterium]|nr:phosphotransferase family protein [Acidimicrobiales bacterium]